jgi:two-component system, NarL family, nitrate/nitrite response regulator NarL
MSAVALAESPRGGPRIALRAQDGLRRKQLERVLGLLVDSDADVVVLDLMQGEAIPPEVAAEAGLLVLSDDAAVAADGQLAGVLPRSATKRQIFAAACAVAEGLVVRVPAPPERNGFAPVDSRDRPLLTPRELQILALVGEGMSNKTIARRLGISAHTVKYHLEAIFTKLDVRSRAEAVSRGLRHGLFVV